MDIMRLGHDGAEYPPLLREIPHRPASLYVRGAWSEALRDNPAIAIVGTRKATAEGRALARTFAGAFARAGLIVVSGLAFGIDAEAHKGALEAGGVTWAVLAAGPDRVYPRSHEQLAARIVAEGGALLSEHPPGTPAFPSQFLARNRIVSGLAKAVVVIEAPHRSGAIATARFALDQNRDIFVVPGPATHPNYGGSHRLIRAGATLAARPEEVLGDMGIGSENMLPDTFGNECEERIITVLSRERRVMTIDEIAAATTLSASEANQALTMLLLRNRIQEAEGGYAL